MNLNDIPPFEATQDQEWAGAAWSLRVLSEAQAEDGMTGNAAVCRVGADTITALRAEIAKLRAALAPFAALHILPSQEFRDEAKITKIHVDCAFTLGDVRRAAALLAAAPSGEQ